MSMKRRGIGKESQIDLSVTEGGREVGREGGNLWGIEVLTHLKKNDKLLRREGVKSSCHHFLVSNYQLYSYNLYEC